MRNLLVLFILFLLVGFQAATAAQAQGSLPDLVVNLTGPTSAAPGDEVGQLLTVEVKNLGGSLAPGTVDASGIPKDPPEGYMIDLVLSTDQVAPEGFAAPSTTFVEDALLPGGRISRTPDVPATGAVILSSSPPISSDIFGAIPGDTPPGSYFVCARIDPGARVTEGDESNNVRCTGIEILGEGPTPSLTLSPDGGEPGSLVTAVGANFPPNASVIIHFGIITVAGGTTDSTGGFAMSFLAPEGFDGPTLVTADVDGVSVDSFFDVFTELQTETVPFEIDGENSVPFHLFSVIAEGTIQAEVTWSGQSQELTVTLTGRRRPALPDPTEAYAEVTGPSPLMLDYTVTADDLARGVGWRLIISDADGGQSALGTIELTTPFDPALDPTFQQEKIGLRSGELWPGAVLQADFLAQIAASGGPGLHGMISLTGACDCYQNRDLEQAGLARQSYLPGRHAYGLIAQGVDLADPEISGLVRYLTPLEPEDKVEPNILVGNYANFVVTPQVGGPTVNRVLNADGTLELSVLFAGDVSVGDAELILLSEVASFSPITDRLWRVTAEPGVDLIALAEHDEVEWIDVGPAPDIDDLNLSRATVNADAVTGAVVNTGAGTIAYSGLTGAGINVGVDEGGRIDETHPDLNVVQHQAHSGVHGTHATHVAGIVAGSGANSAANGGTAFQWRGIAPAAGLIDSSDLVTASNLLSAIQNSSLDLSNHSRSVSFDGNYDAENQTVDQEIRGGTTSGGTSVPRRPQVYSAGNHGTFPNNGGSQIGYFSLTKQMKNVIIVGNWDANNNDLSASSSLGPTYDGRIKPDVVAPGSGVISTGTTGNANSCYANNRINGYGPCSGTSMASPTVSGILALLLEGWQDAYLEPVGSDVDENPPLPSTLRALVIQTATDIVNNDVRNGTLSDIDSDSDGTNGNDGNGRATASTGPDFATGWGLVNAQAAVNLMQESREVNGVPVPKRVIQDSTTQGRITEYDFVVDAAGAVQVTLAWDDVEAAVQNPATSPMLINDLDLELVAPDGTVYYPWQLGQYIFDSNGNILADDAQPPGANITVGLPLNPVANPGASNDYVPAGALSGNGTWVATTGKDHLNNVEQVFVQNAAVGHWTLRVIGFDVQSGSQDYSVVGFPYPDLPELVVFSDDKVGIPGLNEDITFTFQVDNNGPLGTGVDFEYQVMLSTDFSLGDDVVLADSNQASLGPLAAGGSTTHTSTVQITQANVEDLLGPGSTLQDLLDADVFILVRVDSDDEVLEHSETNITFVQLARLVDVIMVMDRSGSMSGTVVVSSGSLSKLAILQDSANLFLDLLRKGAGDRLGEVSFASADSTDFGLVEFTSANLGAAQGAVDALIADGGTNIRDALQTGLDLIPAADTDRRRVIVFFSDGEWTAGNDPTEAAFLQQFDNASVRVYSVGFGTPGGSGYSGIDVELLETLANTGESGFYHVTESAVELDKFFVNAVAGATDSQVIVDPVADIAGGDEDSVSLAVGEQDSIATFVLTWDSPGQELNMALVTPSGMEITEGNYGLFGDRVAFTEAAAYKLFTVHFPLAAGPNEDHSGTWVMEISNPGGTTLTYSASIIAETTVRAEMTIPEAPGLDGFQPGETVGLELNLSQLGGAPIGDAVVTVVSSVPLVGVGNILSSGIVTEAELAAVPTEIDGDALSLQERMVIALQNTLGGNPFQRDEGASVSLEEGATSGTYTGTFTETMIPGVYGFVVNTDALADDCQPVQRQTSHSIVVASEVDPVVTVVTVVSPGPGDYTVTVTPMDSVGNFIGPGFPDDIVVTTSGLAPTGTVQDGLDGSYSQDFVATGTGVGLIEVVALGVALPPLPVDLGAPVVVDVIPGGDRNDVNTTITIGVGAGGGVSLVTGVSLILGDQTVALSGFSVNTAANTVEAQVPAGLSPALYGVRLDTETGKGVASEAGTFRVVGRSQDFPSHVDTILNDVDLLLAASTNSEGIAHLRALMRDLRSAPSGLNFTGLELRDAVSEIALLLSQRRGLIDRSDISAVLSALNRAKIDARYAPRGPVQTAQGQDVKVGLGNGASVQFGQVTGSGETMVALSDGPSEFDEERRGSPHVTYELTTTADFDTSQGLDVELEYEEGDFRDEDILRLFHLEAGVWVDRTTKLDTANNRIRGHVSGLSRFVIAASLEIVKPVRCMGFLATIVGTDGPDILIGTDGDDVIAGLRGNDIVLGRGGNDTICGGRGADVLDGGSGADRIAGGGGPDIVLGGRGHDWLAGGRGNDSVVGGPGHDRVYGGTGHDILRGGKGHDRIFGGRGDDILLGGRGLDRLFGGPGEDEILGGLGDDALAGGPGDDGHRCGPGIDVADGGAGIDLADSSCEVLTNIP